MEMRLGPAARARSLPSFPSSPSARRAGQLCGVRGQRRGCSSCWHGSDRGGRSPAPGEEPWCSPNSTPGSSFAAVRSQLTRPKWTEPKPKSQAHQLGNHGVILCPMLCPRGSCASKMLKRGAEYAARPTRALTDKEPVTQGGGESGPTFPHQGPPQKPSQSAPRPVTSGGTPSRSCRRPPPQRPHRCPDCDKAFSYPSKLATHRLAHGGARPHPCPDCPKAFSYPSKLAAHRLTHSGARPHPCPHCPKAFGHRSKLAAHLWTHAPARPYPCPDCSKSFCYPSKLAAHRHTHHATDSRPYSCPHCPKAFSFPSKLAAHRLCHDPPTAPGNQVTTQHGCSSCGQAFGQRRLLLLHQRSHHQAEGRGERE
ncbi:zinc finger protein 575 isoform X2 [Nycticebus coucang]|uniref:zinc finger protein 575 isoform X2 n=1 Tax=Nycticebus coucang TaxID=9470 RepID=UPI00234CF223|nr:zinc finger protein 575 isoform X2 [Nycticebus coucang]